MRILCKKHNYKSKNKLPFIANSSGSTRIFRCCLQITSSFIELLRNLSIGVSLIDKLILKDEKFELNLPFPVVFENVLVRFSRHAGGSLAGLETLAAVYEDFVRLRLDEELVRLYVAVGAGASRRL